MRMRRWGGPLLCALLVAGAAHAETIASDQAAALIVVPAISVIDGVVDTIIQISNTSDQPVVAKCYYVDATAHCSITGRSCLESSQCLSGPPGNVCIPKWSETDFRILLTPRQPLGWLASQGLSGSDLPIDGVFRRGSDGVSSNAGTRVPPFGNVVRGSEDFANGELKCYTINDDGTPAESNVLKGEATFVNEELTGLDVSEYNAIGFRAIPGTNDGDKHLVLGGDNAEYDGCPNVLILDHFFDGAINPVSGRTITTALILAPCTENFLTQAPERITAQYLVYNEFEQRLSTSAPVDCWSESELSSIDTTNSTRSIFSTGVSGTLTGQTRIRGVNGGLLGVALEIHRGGSSATTAAFNLDIQGERAEPDVITVVQ